MRGYRYSKQEGQLERVTTVKLALTNARLAGMGSDATPIVFGAALENAELVTRQYLLSRVGGINLNKALLHAWGGHGRLAFHPLPPEWRKIVQENGFKVSKLGLAITWNCYVALRLAAGVVAIGKRVFGSIRAPQKRLGSFVYFDALAPGNVHRRGTDRPSRNILAWYSQWPGKIPALDTICHGVEAADGAIDGGIRVTTTSGPIPPLKGAAWLGFIAWSFAAILIGLVDWFRGRWWHALLLGEAEAAAAARLQPPHLLAREYLFHQSGWMYRPLWTYAAEKKGCRITFYFYSTNSEGFKRKTMYPAPYYGWQSSSWPNFLVWNENQADFVRRVAGDRNSISVVGPIWFEDGGADVPVVEASTIAAFDVTPVRNSIYQTLGLDFEYYVASTAVSFLKDVQSVAQAAGIDVLWKRKRELGHAAHPRYRRHAEHLAGCGNVHVVDSRASAFNVIEVADLVVSMPFTSTALIARDQGKPSCYYDPTGLLQKDDRASHGIPILSGLPELQSWIGANLGGARSKPRVS